MVQIYANIYDLQPIEPFFDIDDTGPRGDGDTKWTKESLLEDIRINGIKHQLKIDRFGNILNGNGRYWAARILVKEGYERFRYLPVELVRISGVVYIEFDFHPSHTEAGKAVADIIKGKHNVVPSKTKFEDYVICEEHPKALQRGIDRGDDKWKLFNYKHEDKWITIAFIKDDYNE